MKCPLCNIEMRINATRYVVRNDDSTDKETELYMEQDLICRNSKCPNFQHVVEVKKNPIPLSKQSE